MGKEIERKWMLASAGAVPSFVYDHPSHEIVQGYLCIDPVVRVRRDADEYYLTYKGRGAVEREEYNLPLTGEACERLLAKCDGIIIRKTRYYVPLDECAEASGRNAASAESRSTAGRDAAYMAEVDIFSGYYEGRVYVEVEFETAEAAAAFVAPAWFGEEVTGLPGFSNAALAFGGA